MIRSPQTATSRPALDARPVLRFSVHEDGALEVLSPWFPRVDFDADLLAHADRRRVIVQGDEVEIRCANGGATYVLSPVDAAGVRHGQLLSVQGAVRC